MAARSKGVGAAAEYAADSATIQLPVFADPENRSSELEWMIFDLNEDYLRDKVLPRLVSEYLNPAGEAVYDVSVSPGGPHGPVIFSTRSDGSSVLQGADAAGRDVPSEMGAAGRAGAGGDSMRGALGTLDDRRAASRRVTGYRRGTRPNTQPGGVVAPGRAAGRDGLGAGAIYGSIPAAGGNAVPFRRWGIARSADSAHRHPRGRIQSGGGSGEGAGGGWALRQADPAECRRTHVDDRERAGVFRLAAFEAKRSGSKFLRSAICWNMPRPRWRRRSNRPDAGSK